MRNPLRSKRAITSPVRARSKASGFTRISVRLTCGAPLGSFGGRGLLGRGARRRLLPGRARSLLVVLCRRVLGARGLATFAGRARLARCPLLAWRGALRARLAPP